MGSTFGVDEDPEGSRDEVAAGDAAGAGERGDLSCNFGVGARRADFNGLGVEGAGGETEYEQSSIGEAGGMYRGDAGKGSFVLEWFSGGDDGLKALEGGRVIRSIVSLSEGNSCASTSGRLVMWLSCFDQEDALLDADLLPPLEMENRLLSTGFGFWLWPNSNEESELDEMGMNAELRRDSNGFWC
jgi:hypothetical protein